MAVILRAIVIGSVL